jgi:prevent-host-death family protein
MSCGPSTKVVRRLTKPPAYTKLIPKADLTGSMDRTMSDIGASEAKSRFAELLERVSHGEEITITRHGSPVARMIPVKSASRAEDRRDAVRLMRLFAERHRLEGLRIKDLISEGRK